MFSLLPYLLDQGTLISGLHEEWKEELFSGPLAKSLAPHAMARDAVLPYTDLFLYDLKLLDRQKHREYTGRSNEQIQKNLAYLVQKGATVEIRIPLIPGVNDGEIGQMGAYLSSLGGIRSVRVLPYHAFAASKYTHLGRASAMPSTTPPSREMLEAAKATLRSFGLAVVD